MSIQVHLDTDDAEPDVLIVTGDSELHTRSMRRFFRSVLGGVQVADGWRIPWRSLRREDLILRIYDFLEAAGCDITRGPIVGRSIELALERQRGIARSRAQAMAWKNGYSEISDERVAEQLDSLGWRSERSLFPHQLRNVGHALAATNHANFSVPGAGKTATALAAALIHYEAGTIDAVLVVGPIAAFRPWESESAAVLGSHFAARRIRGRASQRRAHYQSVRRGDLLLTSYAAAAADRPSIKEVCESKNVMLVVDESHRVKRFRGGLWAPSLSEIAELARVRMILSGTPMPNGPRDLYSQLNILWPNELLTGTRNQFASRVERSLPAVLESIRPFTIRTAKAELGLPPFQVKYHSSSMEGIQTEIYELIARRLLHSVANAETWADKIEALSRARPIRLLQAATNPDLLIHTDDQLRLPAIPNPNPTLFERLVRYADNAVDTKTTTALSIIAQLTSDGNKVVVWSNFIRQLDAFSARVRREFSIPVFQVDGRVPAADDPRQEGERLQEYDDDTREYRIDQFLDHNGSAVLVTNPATSSESISLHRACHHAIYLDRTYDAALFLQSIDRVHRLGLDPEVDVTIHILQASCDGDETIDHLVDASLRSKQAEMQMLLEGAEIHPLHQETAEPEGSRADLENLLRFLIGEADVEA